MDIQDLLDWLKNILLEIEALCHKMQLWFDTNSWTQRAFGTETDAEEA